jgi:hypothetical protein
MVGVNPFRRLGIITNAPLTAHKEEQAVVTDVLNKNNLTCSIITDAVSSITSDSTTVVTNQKTESLSTSICECK